MSTLTRSLALYLAVLGLSLALVACGGAKPTPTPATGSTTTSPVFPSLTPVNPFGTPSADGASDADPLGITEEKMLTLLTVEEVQKVVSLPVQPSAVLDNKSLTEAQDPAQVASMNSWFSRFFATENTGQALILRVVDYRFPSAAQGQFGFVAVEQGLKSTNPIIGDGSAVIEFEGDVIDAVLIFYKGDKYVQMESIVLAKVETRLINLEGLAELARIIASRL